MGPYYDNASITHLTHNPEQIRLLERCDNHTDIPPGGDGRWIFGCVMIVLAVIAVSIDMVQQPSGPDDAVQIAHHSSRP